MNIRQKKKRAKMLIVKSVGNFFGNRIRAEHIRLKGVINNKGYIYNHNGFSIVVTVNEKEEQENTAQSADMPNEAAGDELQTAVSGI